MAIIDIDYFNTQMKTLGLKSSFTPETDVLETLLEEASDWVEEYTNRTFEVQEFTEKHVPNQNGRIILDRFPVLEVSEITWEDRAGNTGTVDTENISVYPSGIVESKTNIGALWQTRLYEVTYSAGYEAIPGTVKRATALKVADLLQPQYTGPRERAVELVTEVQEQIITLLERYRYERFW